MPLADVAGKLSARNSPLSCTLLNFIEGVGRISICFCFLLPAMSKYFSAQNSVLGPVPDRISSPLMQVTLTVNPHIDSFSNQAILPLYGCVHDV